MTIRQVTRADIDWIMDLARHHYAGDFDDAAVRAWFLERIGHPDMCFMRGENSGGVTHVMARYYAPRRLQAFLVHLYAFPKAGIEPYRVVEAMVKWAKARGATRYFLSDITGYDLGPFARRLGGEDMGRNYSIELNDGGGRFG